MLAIITLGLGLIFTFLMFAYIVSTVVNENNED